MLIRADPIIPAILTFWHTHCVDLTTEEMMKKFWLITIGVLMLTLSTANILPAQTRQVIAKAESVTGDSFRYFGRTPEGVRIAAVNQPSQAMLKAIDKGFRDLFSVARKNRYGRRLNFSDYTVFIAKADRDINADKKYSPDIAVGAAQYAGTEYDKGGFIYAAGMVIGFNPAAFVIADHQRDFQRVSDTVRFEGEHLVLYHNDRRRFNETADHSKGGSHPILQ